MFQLNQFSADGFSTRTIRASEPALRRAMRNAIAAFAAQGVPAHLVLTDPQGRVIDVQTTA